jgi:hypothetical protein
LTQKGRKLSQVMRSAAYEVEEIASQGLSADEIKEFFRITGIMTRNLNTERFGRK